ncbi:hypothetical protein WA588_002850, partial [Blastocystis sp. NMH]
MEERRNSFILGMMSSSPSIKAMAVVFWLIDNCGFVIKSYCTQIHSIPIGNLSKEDVVLNKENHTAVFSYGGFTSTVYLNLFGDLGLKVFETLEIVKEDYMSRQFCLNRYTSYPDFDHYCATSDFPRDCAAERLLFLLNRDPSLDLTGEGILVEHLCDVFSRIFEYVNGFTGTHEFHPSDYDASSVHVQVRMKVLLRSALEDYGYLKMQYLNKKRGKTVTLRLDNKKAKQLLLEDYSKEELKMMYKMSKKRFYALKDCLEKKKHISLISFLFDPAVVTLISWTRPSVLRNWLKEKGHDVDSLFIG